MKKIRIEEVQRTQTVNCNGITLIVGTRNIGNGKWELFIENNHGIRSIWTEFFNSSKTAMREGINAIENEGVEPFSDKEGYEYLINH